MTAVTVTVPSRPNFLTVGRPSSIRPYTVYGTVRSPRSKILRSILYLHLFASHPKLDHVLTYLHHILYYYDRIFTPCYALCASSLERIFTSWCYVLWSKYIFILPRRITCKLLYHFDRFVGHASRGPLDGDEFWCRSQVTGPVGCLYLA